MRERERRERSRATISLGAPSFEERLDTCAASDLRSPFVDAHRAVDRTSERKTTREIERGLTSAFRCTTTNTNTNSSIVVFVSSTTAPFLRLRQRGNDFFPLFCLFFFYSSCFHFFFIFSFRRFIIFPSRNREGRV